MNTKLNIIKAIMLILFSGLLFYKTVGMINKSSGIFPDGYSYINNGDGKILFSEISETQKSELYPENILINAVSFSSGYAQSVGGILAYADIIFTDKNYVDFHDINIIKGSLFSDSADNISAVISENLANRLFKTTDIIGGKFYLSDKEITVAGVYKPDKIFLSEIASDGKEYIIISYSFDFLHNKADYLYAKAQTADGHFSALDEIKLNSLLDGKLNNYYKINLSENKRIISQFKDMLFFLTGVIINIFLAKKILKYCALLMNGENKRTAIYIKISAGVIILIIIAFISSFELHIPPDFFPDDKNILNLRHYASLYKYFIQAQNTSGYYFYNNLYFWSIILVIPLIILNLTAVAITVFAVNKYLKKLVLY